MEIGRRYQAKYIKELTAKVEILTNVPNDDSTELVQDEDFEDLGTEELANLPPEDEQDDDSGDDMDVNHVFSMNKIISTYVNECPKENSRARKYPIIYENKSDYRTEDLKAAMKKEFDSLKSFEVFEEVDRSSISPNTEILSARWVFTWKGYVKARLVVRGFEQSYNEVDDNYASTPMMSSLRPVSYTHLTLPTKRIV